MMILPQLEIRYQRKKITIAQLLDHTSGMEADMGEEIEFFDMLTNQGLPHNSIAKNV
jgi:CubicO group peptidase (beta-lactamase class C family)